MLIGLVRVTAGRIRLPDFDESSADRAVCFIDHPAAHDDSLAERCTTMMAGQIAFERSEMLGCKPRAGDFGQGGWNCYQ